MLSKLRRHLTYANVVSTICLFIILGGSAYAVAQVGSKQIKNNSIQSKDIKNGGVSSPDVKNGSLRTKDFKRGDIPAGPRGAEGQRGPAGAAGSALAYARVGPAIGTVLLTLDQANSKNVVQVPIQDETFPGAACLNVAGAVKPRNGVATIDGSGSDARDHVTVTFDQAQVDSVCQPGADTVVQIQVFEGLGTDYNQPAFLLFN